MDEDLIKLVNKLQDTFSNLGGCPLVSIYRVAVHRLLNLITPTSWVAFVGGELDMPQLVVVRKLRAVDTLCTPMELSPLCRSAANRQANPAYSKSE